MAARKAALRADNHRKFMNSNEIVSEYQFENNPSRASLPQISQPTMPDHSKSYVTDSSLPKLGFNNIDNDQRDNDRSLL
jgi:hypothetical protein